VRLHYKQTCRFSASDVYPGSDTSRDCVAVSTLKLRRHTDLLFRKRRIISAGYLD
jgi:hypothetical protein